MSCSLHVVFAPCRVRSMSCSLHVVFSPCRVLVRIWRTLVIILNKSESTEDAGQVEANMQVLTICKFDLESVGRSWSRTFAMMLLMANMTSIIAVLYIFTPAFTVSGY